MTEEISFNFEFQTPTKIDIEEAAHGVATIEGTLLAEGVSRNNNLYTLPEMENIANQAVGIPIYYGTKVGINPNTGTICSTLHDDSDEQWIGKIIEAKLDKIARKIHFIAEVFNTEAHPDMIQQIKGGWGVSIGGFVTKAEYVKDEFGKQLLKIKDMIVRHLSVIPPTTIRGMDAAKIDNVHVQETLMIEESMLFDIPALPVAEIQTEESYEPVTLKFVLL